MLIGDSTMLFWTSFAGATLIALVHLLTPRFLFMRRPGNLWGPAAVGVALAYVFMDIFPHLAKMQDKLDHTVGGSIYGFLTHNIYLIGLTGFSIYLGIILMVMKVRNSGAAAEINFMRAPAAVTVEWFSLVAYNFLIGYLLSEQATHRPEPAVIFALAMAIHFVGFDSIMCAHFPILYDRPMRFLLATGVYAGWITGVVIEISDESLALWYSFLAGGIVVVATVYELPQIRSRRQYGSFLLGTVVFTALVLTLEQF